MKLTIKSLAALALIMSFGSAWAVPISSCPDTAVNTDREMWVDNADACGFIEGNPQAGDIAAFMETPDWVILAEIERDDGVGGTSSDSPLTITLADGDLWGDDPDKIMSGTWHLDAGFWDIYGSAVLSFHFGGGQGSPDGFMFALTPGEYWGDWHYDGSCCNGGGLSNVKIWVPEPMTFLLLASGLIGLGLRRR